MLVVANSRIQFLHDLKAKKRVIWHTGMQFLYCFGEQFYNDLDGAFGETVWCEYYPGFSLAYPRNLPREDRQVPLGFQTSGLAYIVQKTRWLNRQDANGTIAADTIVDEIERWLRTKDSLNRAQHLMNPALATARDFLFSERIRIPSTVWQHALPKVRH